MPFWTLRTFHFVYFNLESYDISSCASKLCQRFLSNYSASLPLPPHASYGMPHAFFSFCFFPYLVQHLWILVRSSGRFSSFAFCRRPQTPVPKRPTLLLLLHHILSMPPPFSVLSHTHTLRSPVFQSCLFFSILFFCACLFNRFKPAVTLLKLNTAVDQDFSASLSVSLTDLLAVHRPSLDRLIIVAAVQPPKRHQVRYTPICDLI